MIYNLILLFKNLPYCDSLFNLCENIRYVLTLNIANKDTHSEEALSRPAIIFRHPRFRAALTKM